MYEYEVPAPEGTWATIIENIGNGKVIPIKKIRNFSTTLIAAAITLFIFVSIFFEMRPEANSNIETHYVIIASAPSIDKPALKNNYITLQGPEGKVKVSRKVAQLFIAPETPSKASWNKKLAHWKSIMMTASNTDFMDVIPMTQLAETEN